MNKKRKTAVHTMVVLALCLVLILTGTLPVLAAVMNAPQVTAEMNHAAYWLQGLSNSTDLLLAPDAIASFNQKVYAQVDANYQDIQQYPTTVNGTKVAAAITELFSKTELYQGQSKLNDEDAAALKDNMAFTALSGEIAVRWGIVVRNTPMKIVPLDDFPQTTGSSRTYDELQQSTLLLQDAVAILHASADGAWYWVETNDGAGWVKSADIALCTSQSQWLAAQEPNDFLMITAPSIPLNISNTTTNLANLTLTMGTKLPLVSTVGNVDGRKPYGNYVVQIPTRNSSGYLTYQQALIPASQDVSEGYLSYTREHLLEQAFKWQGYYYGASGSYAERDSAIWLRDIFRTFGIKLPDNIANIMQIPGEKMDLTGRNDVEKAAAIASLQPGTLLSSADHIMLYLGTVNSTPYVISAVDQLDGMNVHSVIVSGLTTVANGSTYLEEITTALTIPAGSMMIPSKPVQPSVEVVKYPFQDIADTPYCDSIVRLHAVGIVNGKSETFYVPNDNITRGEFATILMRAFQLDANTDYAEAKYKDAKGYALAGAVGAVAKAGYMTGVASNYFDVNGPLNFADTQALIEKLLWKEVPDAAAIKQVQEKLAPQLDGKSGPVNRGQMANILDALLQALAALQ